MLSTSSSDGAAASSVNGFDAMMLAHRRSEIKAPVDGQVRLTTMLQVIVERELETQIDPCEVQWTKVQPDAKAAVTSHKPDLGSHLLRR